MRCDMRVNLPTLGVGIGFRRPLLGEILLQRDGIDFLEIIADHYLDPTPEQEEELELLAAHFRLIPHAINLSLGSADGMDCDYLGKLAGLIRRLDPPWWSEHLSFTRAGGLEVGHLAPMPFSREAVSVLCRNIGAATCRIETPLIVENVAYVVGFPGAEMTEAQFIAQVLERSRAGLLLDVTNLDANATNHGYDAYEFLDQLPLERVVQLHFAGGHWRDGVLVDSHSQPTPDEAWQLMAEVTARVSIKGAILERDENLPPFPSLLEELEHARRISLGDRE